MVVSNRAPEKDCAAGRGVGLGLSGALVGGAQQFLRGVGGLGFEVAQVLIGRGQEAGEGRIQRDRSAGRQHGQSLRDEGGRKARTDGTG